MSRTAGIGGVRTRKTAWRTSALLVSVLAMGGCSSLGEEMPNLFASKSDAQPPALADAASPPQDELQKATEYWGKEYEKKPRDLNAALSYAKNLKAMGQKGQALTVLQQASLYHGDDRKLASEYGRLALEFDQVSVAQQLLALADDPTSPDWRVISARGTVLAKQGNYAEAIPFYERALSLAKDQPSVLNNLALAQAMNGDASKAEELLRTAVARDSSDRRTRQNLALVLGLQGKYDEATKTASSVVAPTVAAENTALLRQIVKLDPKTAPTSPVPAAATAVASTTTGAPALKPTATDTAAAVAAGWNAKVASVAPATTESLPWTGTTTTTTTPASVAASDSAGFKPSSN